MPKILRIFNRCIIGGPIINASYLTRYLQPDFETLLLMGAKDDHEQSADHLIRQLGISYQNVPHMIRSVNPLNDILAYREIRRIIRAFKPDIVHTHAAKPGALGRLAAAAEKVPVIVHTYHGHVFHSYFNSFKTKAFIKAERYLAGKSTAIIAISEAQKSELAHTFKIADPEIFRVIPLGLDLDKFQQNQQEKRARFRAQYQVEDDEICIGIIGRLVPVKNHSLFLHALHHVLGHTTKKVRAFIVGDGETRPQLEALATQLQITFSTPEDPNPHQPLVFTSWRSDIDVVNAGLDVIALTSFNEGTPVSLIEAQAANKPVVSTRVGGIADVVIENETALLSHINEGGQFADNLLRIVNDDALRHHLSEKNSDHVMQRFSYQRLVTDMSELYWQLLSKKSAHVVL